MNFNVSVLGLQWGDEGKGKLVDLLAANFEIVCRYCGGANAGHTVVENGHKHALHLLPCGIFRKDVKNIIGNGVAFDPFVCVEELEGLKKKGFDIEPAQLQISLNCNLVLPWHRQYDTLFEQNLGSGKIGTTGRGIGPLYSDRASRTLAIRAEELLGSHAELKKKIEYICDVKNKIHVALFPGCEKLDADVIAKDIFAAADVLAPHISNTGAFLRRIHRESGPGSVLFEGGQGSMLDIEHGTFPFVTSSCVTGAGIPQGVGLSPKYLGYVVGIVKAYCSRVGSGSFPSEQDNEVGQRIRDRGHEFGTTTGRPRRCGWLDIFALKYAIELSGVDEIVLTLLDVLSGFDELSLCIGYELPDGSIERDDYNATDSFLEVVEPMYEIHAGWKEEITEIRCFEDFPESAQLYIQRIEELIGVPIGWISVGPDRTQMVRYHSNLDL